MQATAPYVSIVLAIVSLLAGADASVANDSATGAEPVTTARTSEPAQLSGDLKQVMVRWTEAAAGIETLQCRFVRQDFDLSHHAETRGQGHIRYEAEGRAMYALEPYPLQSKPRSTRSTDRGVPFSLQACKAETLYWVSGQIARINPVAREFELFEVPEPFLSPGVVEATESFDVLWTTLGCLERHVPGLIEPDLEELTSRFTWSLFSMDQDRIVLTAKPLTAADQRHYSQFFVYLDAKTYLTVGTKAVDSTGAREVVHSFVEMKANIVPPATAPDWAPDIGRMRLLTAPPLAPPASND